MKHKVGDKVTVSGSPNQMAYTIRVAEPDSNGWLVGEDPRKRYVLLDDLDAQLIPVPKPQHTLGNIVFEETGENHAPVNEWCILEGFPHWVGTELQSLQRLRVILKPIYILQDSPRDTNLNG
jgi:hypothetical protein